MGWRAWSLIAMWDEYRSDSLVAHEIGGTRDGSSCNAALPS